MAKGASVIKTKLLCVPTHTGDGTEEDNIAEITVDRDSILVGYQICLNFVPTADVMNAIAEVSTNPNYQGNANASIGQIAIVQNAYALDTNGGTQTAQVVSFTLPVPMPMRAGEKIYLNSQASATCVWSFRGVFFFKELN